MWPPRIELSGKSSRRSACHGTSASNKVLMRSRRKLRASLGHPEILRALPLSLNQRSGLLMHSNEDLRPLPSLRTMPQPRDVEPHPVYFEISQILHDNLQTNVSKTWLLAYYKRKPQDNMIPIKTLVIDGNFRVEDRGLKTHHGHHQGSMSVNGNKIYIPIDYKSSLENGRNASSSDLHSN